MSPKNIKLFHWLDWGQIKSRVWMHLSCGRTIILQQLKTTSIFSSLVPFMSLVTIESDSTYGVTCPSRLEFSSPGLYSNEWEDWLPVHGKTKSSGLGQTKADVSKSLYSEELALLSLERGQKTAKASTCSKIHSQLGTAFTSLWMYQVGVRHLQCFCFCPVKLIALQETF